MTKLDVLVKKIKDGDYNMGHMILDLLKQWNPDDLGQIDAGTGETETYGSMLSRIVQLARCMQALGLQPGDVLALAGRNHIHLRIPHFAAMVNGYPVAGVDPTFKYEEVKHIFTLTKPKIAFCDQDSYEIYSKVAKDLGLDTKIITFDGEETNMAKFMESCKQIPVADFKPPVFDTNKVYVWLVSTSGTTGAPKLAAIRHYEAAKQTVSLMQRMMRTGNNNIGLNVSPTQWLSGCVNTFGLIVMNGTILQSSQTNSADHIVDVINKYRPTFFPSGPSLLSLMMRNDKVCDMSSIKCVMSGGAKIYLEMVTELKSRLHKDAEVIECYGQTEAVGLVTCGGNDAPIGSCGRVSSVYTVKLVDPETGKEITEPNKPGELWINGLTFTEYYNNPEETAKTFTEDGWLKTGDLFYRDEKGYYYFVERLKMLIKYRSQHIVPPELEELILELEGVKEVCVTSVPHVIDGQHPVACVVLRPGYNVTAQQIKDLVAERLSDNKKLRGGVVFMDELPKTSTTKVARNKVQEYVKTAHRE